MDQDDLKVFPIKSEKDLQSCKLKVCLELVEYQGCCFSLECLCSIFSVKEKRKESQKNVIPLHNCFMALLFDYQYDMGYFL